MSIKIKGDFRVVTKNGKTIVEHDEQKTLAKLPVNKRIARKNSKKVRVVKK